MADSDTGNLDTNSWYGPDQVKVLFGVSYASQTLGRESGQLQYSMAGESIVYYGSWLSEWFTANRQRVSGNSAYRGGQN